MAKQTQDDRYLKHLAEMMAVSVEAVRREMALQIQEQRDPQFIPPEA